MLPAAELAIVPCRIPLDFPSELGCGSDEEGTSRMRFHADLHVHSKYSRATSRDLDLEHLAHWAGRKGIGVVGTGDFTHPVWLRRAQGQARAGRARPVPPARRHRAAVAATLPAACRAPRALHARGGDLHHLQEGRPHPQDPSPDLRARLRRPPTACPARLGAHRQHRLRRAPDPRPRTRATCWRSRSNPARDAYLVPAHIWTPWFAALGSQSGFDSIADCYGDLADHIFAVETGLSSDPPMNWRVSFLDRYRLTSNSDAHSPGKLGREATTFDCELDYFAIKRALETGDGYVGTVEFFPEEGKYHLDGHRKCDVRLEPEGDARAWRALPGLRRAAHHRRRAPRRGARRPQRAEAKPPPTAGTVSNLVPLPEMLSEITAQRAGEQDRGAQLRPADRRARAGARDPAARCRSRTSRRAGSRCWPRRSRGCAPGKVIRDAGYDGEYGVIRLFEDERAEAAAPPAGCCSTRRSRNASASRARRRRPCPRPLAGERQCRATAHDPWPPRRLRLARTTRCRAPCTGLAGGLDHDQRAAAQASTGRC